MSSTETKAEMPSTAQNQPGGATSSPSVSTDSVTISSSSSIQHSLPRPLPVLRAHIDTVDSQIVKLLNDRSRLVVEVGLQKAADGTPVYAPHREQAVLSKVLAMNTGPMLNVTLESIYREIMSGSFQLERPLRIGYLGPPGSFSHDAATKQFGLSVSYEDLRAIDGVFEEVARGHVDYGLVPIENGSIGSVVETLDSIMEYSGRTSICAEVQLSVCQALITCPGAVPSDIKEVHSKAEALAQCRKWLATQYPQAVLVPAASTSAAVALVSRSYAEGGTEKAKRIAAVGSALAASLHDLPVMFGDIQDVTPNITRFVVLCSPGTAAAVTAPSGDDKTSVLFVCDDRPGALVDVLDAFRRHSINLTHIDKRPCSPEHLTQLVGSSDKKKLSALSPVGLAASPVLVNSVNGGGGGSSSGMLPDSATTAARKVAAVSTPESSPALTSAAATTITVTDGSSSTTSSSFALDSSPPSDSTTTTTTTSSPLVYHVPSMAVAPSLYVPSLLGGRGGLSKSFTYAFFIEAAAHISSPDMNAALREAAPLCLCLKVMGSYPRARRVL